MRFRDINPQLMDLPEIQKELSYQTKRLYRLRKLERMGKEVDPDLFECEMREGSLDMELRLRLRGMADIPG